MIILKRTERDFVRGEFLDSYGKKCSIQESSKLTPKQLWLGSDENLNKTDNERMLLNQEQARDLIPLLLFFVREGRLPIESHE